MNDTLKSIFRTLSENAEENFIKNKNAEDYLAEDGLWHCGKCGTAKQFRLPEQFTKMGMPEIVGCCCACQSAKEKREKAEYQDFLKDFMDDMKECVRLAKEAGIEDDKIILDPGVGFGKTYEMNLEIIDKMEVLNELGYPVLLGTSRKSVIGLTLDLPVTQREEGTMVTTVYGVQKGCAFVRVHDVEKNKRAIQMTKAIMRGHEV